MASQEMHTDPITARVGWVEPQAKPIVCGEQG